jgi:hypothetical protein
MKNSYYSLRILEKFKRVFLNNSTLFCESQNNSKGFPEGLIRKLILLLKYIV